MSTIWIVPIEPIDQRYTKQWYDEIPRLIIDKAIGWNVITIEAETVADKTTSGAFLDFTNTNIYKSRQVEQISRLFNVGYIKPYDRFLVTDAWNFVVTAIRYMSDLLNIPVEIHSIWHAGAYDPTDILGMQMNKPWPWLFEQSVYHACDYNYYATEFHKNMFLTNLNIQEQYHHKAVVSGQPHIAIINYFKLNLPLTKEDYIMWPHRYNEDKQPQIAEDIAKTVDINFTQKMNLTKDEYYTKLRTAKAVFSCSLHENLGISIMEGVLAGAIPIVPDRAAYSEMYLDCFKYPSKYTKSYVDYETNKAAITGIIVNMMNDYNSYKEKLEEQKNILLNKYLSADVMINNITR